MGILDGIVKGLAIASAAGWTTRYLLDSMLKLSFAISAIGTGLGAMSGFLYYCRVWIQGYWWDRVYPVSPGTSLKGKVAVVTGGTLGGLGFATAEWLASLGATVIITCRNKHKGNEAMETLHRNKSKDAIIHCVFIDFLSNQSVRAGAVAIHKFTHRLDFLILNAGIAKGPPAEIWQTNHVGPFLLVQELTTLLKTTATKNDSSVRVVSLSSGAHKNASIHWKDPFAVNDQTLFAGAYGQSKLANILHMRQLQTQINDDSETNNNNNNIKCFPVTPGAVQTNLTPSNLPWPAQVFLKCVLRTPHTGIQVIQMACLDQTIPGGSYLSNCCVKTTEGLNGCSNDEGQCNKLWELTERQIQENRFP